MRASYPIQVIATVIPVTVTVEQVVSGGNMMLAFLAGLLAVLAGRWAWRKQRTEAKTAAIELQIAQLRLQEERKRAARRR